LNEPIVYLVQSPPPIYRNGTPIHKDLSSAQRYGAIHPVLGEDDHPSITPGPSLSKVSKVLRDFRPDTDYLCSAGGDPMALALSTLALASWNIHEFTLLRWERERETDGTRKGGGFYVPITVPTRLT